MAVMKMDIPLTVVNAGRLDEVLGDDSLWEQAARAGMNDSSVLVDPDDHSKVTILSHWGSVEALRDHGQQLVDRVVKSLNENGLEVTGDPKSQTFVSARRAAAQE